MGMKRAINPSRRRLLRKTCVGQPVRNEAAKSECSKPGNTVACFFNSVFGHTRNWPRAYSCLAPSARERFGPGPGLQSFADYWDDKLSFLEELVRARHREYPYTHRSCFSLDRIEKKQLAGDRAVFRVELVENHVARDRLMLVQTKELLTHDGRWLLASGELEGNLDDIIIMRIPHAGRAS